MSDVNFNIYTIFHRGNISLMVLNVYKIGLEFPVDKSTWQTFNGLVEKYIKVICEENEVQTSVRALYLMEGKDEVHSVSSRVVRKIFTMLQKMEIKDQKSSEFITLIDCTKCGGVDVGVYLPFFCWDVGGSLYYGLNEKGVMCYYLSPYCAVCLNRFENDGDEECPLHGGVGCWCSEMLSSEVVLGKTIQD